MLAAVASRCGAFAAAGAASRSAVGARTLLAVHAQPSCVLLATELRWCLHTGTASPAAADEAPKSGRGRLPSGAGPPKATLRALPFGVDRQQAEAAFRDYHAQKWYQVPAVSKPFRESFLPFWVASGTAAVVVHGAEVGRRQLITRRSSAGGHAEPRWETVWTRVSLTLSWRRALQPEDEEAQLYASWKYPRRDIDALRPRQMVSLARSITPDMLQATRGSGTDTRRVGAFTLDPHTARRLIAAGVEAAERRRAEQQIKEISGADEVRFIDMDIKWGPGAPNWPSGSTEAGLALSPVYVPAYVFSWWHGGTKVRTYVSGVDGAASGAQVLDDAKLATVAAAASTTVGLLLGLPLPVLFWGTFALPFVAAGLIARFWPLLRTRALAAADAGSRAAGTLRDAATGLGAAAARTPQWDADFVQAYATYEARQQAEEARRARAQHARSSSGDAGSGSTAGVNEDPAEAFMRFVRDPFSFFEHMYARQQQAAQQRGRHHDPGSTSQQANRQQQQQQQWRQQQQQRRRQQQQQQHDSGRNPRDPRGFYAQLGLSPGASPDEVSAAFRGAALRHHPDRHTGEADKAAATQRFQKITEAYQTLRDPKRRAAYDAGGI